jgi:hypothetical protein
VLERLCAVADGDVGPLRGLLAPEELAATQRRAALLAHEGVLPMPDEEGRYPPWPWPIV